MKKISAVIITAALLLSCFTGCNGTVIPDNNNETDKDAQGKYTDSILLTLSDYDYTEALLSDEDVISTNTKSEGIVLFGHNAKQVRKTFSQGDGEKNRGFEFYDADTDELFFAAISSKLMIADTVDGQNDVIISEYNNNGTTQYELYYSTGDGIKKADLSKDITKAIPADAYDLKLNGKNCFIYSTPGEYQDGRIFTYCCFDLSYDSVMIYDTWDITEEPYSKFESNTDEWYTEIKDHEDGHGQIISVFGPDGKHFAYSNSDLRFRIDDYIISRDLIIHPTQKYAALIYNGHDTYRWGACTTCTVISLETGEIISLDDSITLEDMREGHFSPKGPVNYSADTLDEFVAEERNSIFPAHRIRHFVSITEDGFDIKVAGTDIEGNIILDNIYRYAVPARENGITAGCAPEHGFEPQDSALSELAISACKGKIPHEEFLADSDAQKFIAENLSLIVEKELSTDDFDVYVVAPDAMYPMTVVLSECDEYNTLLSFRLTDYGHFVYSIPYKLYGKYEEDRLIAAYSPECIYINKNDLSRAIEESTDIDTKTVEYRGLYMSSEEERKVTVPIFSGAELYIAVLYIENDLTYSLESCEKTDPRSLSAKDFFISHKAFGFKPIDLINNDRGISLSPEKEITAVLGSAVIPEGTNIYSSFGDHPHTLPTISITTTDETVYMLRNKHTGQFISSSDIESDISLGDLEWWVRSSTDYVTDSDKHTLYIGNYTGEVKDGKANGRGKFLFGDGSTYSGEWKDGQINGYGTYLFVSGDIYTGEYINGVRNGQGTYTFTDGAVYTGTFKDGKRDGQGVFSFPNGNVYSGQFSDGNFHGSGTYSYANGDSYVGEYSNGRQNGQGIFTFADGENYVGGFSNGMYHGSGTYTHINGDVYTGEYSNGKRNGIGTSTYANGDQYTGEWKNGKREGQGTYTYASGDQYTGEWKNGKPDGQGTYTFADGAVYTGEYKDGKYNGYGKLTYDNGDVYVGWWKDDKRNGKGIYTFATGSFYNGEWKDGNYHGSGTFVYSNGNKYVGEFIDGNKNGQGTYTFANGSFYTGEWKDDKRHGQGTITYIDGNVYSGEWRDDKYYNGTLVYNNGTAYTGEWKDDKYHGSGTLTFSTGRKLSGKWENGNYISE